MLIVPGYFWLCSGLCGIKAAGKKRFMSRNFPPGASASGPRELDSAWPERDRFHLLYDSTTTLDHLTFSESPIRLFELWSNPRRLYMILLLVCLSDNLEESCFYDSRNVASQAPRFCDPRNTA